jgi:hypothetical protein
MATQQQKTPVNKKNISRNGNYFIRNNGTSFPAKNRNMTDKDIHYRPVDPNKPKDKKISYRSKLEKNNKIVLADKDVESGLDLFCYTKCDNSSPLQVKRARGLVFHGNELVLKTFPYTDEYSVNDQESIKLIIKPIFEDPELLKNTRFFKSYEGSLVRVFNFKGKWYVTTHRKLDAFKSKWASTVSFGEIFLEGLKEIFSQQDETREEVFDKFFKRLDPSKSYMFLVLSNEQNRIVCDASTVPTVYHVGTYENFPSKVFSLDEDVGIPKPEEFKFTTLDEMIKEIEDMSPSKNQGIIIFSTTFQQIKILNSEYFYLFNLRGNEPSIKFRYLQIRTDFDRCKDFCSLYSTHDSDFKNYESILEKISKDIYNAYVKRYIKKEKVVVPTEEFQVMRKCQAWYFEDPRKNKVTDKIILEALDYENPICLNKMIKRLLLEEKKTKKDMEDKETEKLQDRTEFPELISVELENISIDKKNQN